jgi:lipopolysaccharide biosynthesis glycosyltransferase
MNNDDIIPIVFSSNDYFVPYMSAAIQSVIENASKDRQYIIYILHKGLLENNISLLKEQIMVFNRFCIEFVDVTNYIKDYTFFLENNKSLTIETYFRILIPFIFNHYEKVIYLDGDIICLKDISELYDYDIKDYLIAGAKDILGAHKYYIDDVKKPGKNRRYEYISTHINDYFIAGTLLFNIKAFNKLFSVSDILELALSRQWEYHDQDILNYICKSKVYYIDMSWCFSFISPKSLPLLPLLFQNEYFAAQEIPNIIHFAWILKPWKTAFYTPYFYYFWKYATRTLFITEIITRMNNEQFIAKHSLTRDIILDIIKHRKGIGLKYLIKCIITWLFSIKIH